MGKIEHHRHYFRPGALGTERCLTCGRPDGPPHVLPPRQWKSAIRRILAEDPHRMFRPVEVTRISTNDRHPLEGRNVLRGLVAASYATLIHSTGHVAWFQLTSRGLKWSELETSTTLPSSGAGAGPSLPSAERTTAMPGC
jgi:hypothetical protein